MQCSRVVREIAECQNYKNSRSKTTTTTHDVPSQDLLDKGYGLMDAERAPMWLPRNDMRNIVVFVSAIAVDAEHIMENVRKATIRGDTFTPQHQRRHLISTIRTLGRRRQSAHGVCNSLGFGFRRIHGGGQAGEIAIWKGWRILDRTPAAAGWTFRGGVAARWVTQNCTTWDLARHLGLSTGTGILIMKANARVKAIWLRTKVMLSTQPLVRAGEERPDTYSYRYRVRGTVNQQRGCQFASVNEPVSRNMIMVKECTIAVIHVILSNGCRIIDLPVFVYRYYT